MNGVREGVTAWDVLDFVASMCFGMVAAMRFLRNDAAFALHEGMHGVVTAGTPDDARSQCSMPWSWHGPHSVTGVP